MSRKLGAPGHEPGESGPARRDYIRRRAEEQNAAAFAQTPPTNPEPATAVELRRWLLDTTDVLPHRPGGHSRWNRELDRRIAVVVSEARAVGAQAERAVIAPQLNEVRSAARAEALADLRRGVASLENPGEVDSEWRWGFESAVIRVLALLPDPPK